MELQYLIVILIVAAAVAYAVVMLRKSSRSFAPKSGCGDDCGCNGKSKKLIS